MNIVSPIALPFPREDDAHQPDLVVDDVVPGHADALELRSIARSVTLDVGVPLIFEHDASSTEVRWRMGAVTCKLLDGDRRLLLGRTTTRDDAIAHYLIAGPLLSWVLHRRGFTVLHASAVRIGDDGVGFLAPSHGGKSSLAAAMVKAGFALLTDDVLPIEAAEAEGVWTVPAHPTVKLRAAAARCLGGLPLHDDASPTEYALGVDALHGRFCEAPTRLRRLYVLSLGAASSGNGAARITALSGREALMALLGSVHLGAWFDDDAQTRLLRTLTQVVRAVEVKRLEYAAGFDRLPYVRDAIVQDASRS